MRINQPVSATWYSAARCSPLLTPFCHIKVNWTRYANKQYEQLEGEEHQERAWVVSGTEVEVAIFRPEEPITLDSVDCKLRSDLVTVEGEP